MARAKKTATPEEKRRAKDKRLRTKFGISIETHDGMAEEQEHRCKCCRGPLEAYGPPQVDHYHFYIKVSRHFDTFLMANDGWEAQGFDEQGRVICVRRAFTKVEAKAAVKKIMMPWSIRGLCCFKCNRGMGSVEKFFDAARHPENLSRLIAYYAVRLEKPLTML